MKDLILKIKNKFSKNKDLDSNVAYDSEAIKISGTKEYIDIEYKGKIARFGGELCIDGFAAIVSSMSWVKHIGPLYDGEQEELMHAVCEYSKKHKSCRVSFYDDKNNEIKF